MVPGQFHDEKETDGEDWRCLRCERRTQRGVTNKGDEDDIYGAENGLAQATAMWENALTWGDRREALEMYGARLRDDDMLLMLKRDEEEVGKDAMERERGEFRSSVSSVGPVFCFSPKMDFGWNKDGLRNQKISRLSIHMAETVKGGCAPEASCPDGFPPGG